MNQNKTLIKVENVSKSFGDIKALRGVSMSLQAGQVIALLGENGAGKTTLINHLLGRETPDSGSVSIAGHTPGSYPARQTIGAVLQSAAMPETLTVKEHIELFSSYYSSPRTLTNTLEIAGLTELQNRKFKALSGGQKQRVLFAIAICGQPPIILLDEPTVGLDVQSRRQFWQCIRNLREQGTCVLLTTHYLEEADALADQVLLLNKGEIVHQGSSESLKQRLGGKRIRFTYSDPTAAFEHLPAVNHVMYRGSQIELISECAEETATALLTQYPTLSDLTIEQVSLEDAFIHFSVKDNDKELAA
ncbi:ABC transporter ATP-binding protein [Pleionea sediminis]|uniref:ABC transporter ATP-binding protein n=1 Tax=Pleionea sediminis TaxID=2569479 RepID=UPI001186FA7D|nr:ABC transporter ATP-binding protein [Pleionea sediminis]